MPLALFFGACFQVATFTCSLLRCADKVSLGFTKSLIDISLISMPLHASLVREISAFERITRMSNRELHKGIT